MKLFSVGNKHVNLDSVISIEITGTTIAFLFETATTLTWTVQNPGYILCQIDKLLGSESNFLMCEDIVGIGFVINDMKMAAGSSFPALNLKGAGFNPAWDGTYVSGNINGGFKSDALDVILPVTSVIGTDQLTASGTATVTSTPGVYPVEFYLLGASHFTCFTITVY